MVRFYHETALPTTPPNDSCISWAWGRRPRQHPLLYRDPFIGLDVHADTIAVVIAEPTGEVRSVGVIPNRPESIRKLVKKLGAAEELRVCYEAGPTRAAAHRGGDEGVTPEVSV